MIQSKKIHVIAIIMMVFALTTVVLLIGFGNMGVFGKTKQEPYYATKVFGTEIISIEILADEADWQEMLDNAINEQFIMVNVIVNGTKFENVGIRPKGNSSLSQVASNDTSDRYSFRLQFNEYVKDQTCFGLESFVVNNMTGDYTYMKEYISYDLMQEIGVDSPYFGFADIRVNGKEWGLYLAVETYNDSYEQRTFGTTAGMLYNVKMDMGNMDGGDFENMNQGNRFPQFNTDESSEEIQNNDEGILQFDGSTEGIPSGGNGFPQFDGSMEGMPSGGNGFPQFETNNSTEENSNSEFPQSNTEESLTINPSTDTNTNNRFNFGGMGGGSTGGSLEYIDDNESSYSAIFNNVVGKGTEKDYQRVIKALKALSEGRDLEKYFDVDQILRYLVAHTIVVNLDSYSSGMAQNYYIYEKDGQITILPWDYNLAWGGYQSTSASSVINFPIDTPVSGVDMTARPLLEKLFANTEYLERYHSYLQELIDNYFANGKFEAKINELDRLIGEYVKNDNTAFCTYEQYQTAIAAFITLGNLRAESIQGQLNGTIPSTTEAQTKNSDKLISADNLNLSDLGTMMGGMGGRDMQNDTQGFPNMDAGFDMQAMQQAMVILQEANNEITDEVREKLYELGIIDEQIEMFGNMPAGMRGGNGDNRNSINPENSVNSMNQTNTTTVDKNYLIFVGILSAVLIVAIFFTARFKKSY